MNHKPTLILVIHGLETRFLNLKSWTCWFQNLYNTKQQEKVQIQGLEKHNT